MKNIIYINPHTLKAHEVFSKPRAFLLLLKILFENKFKTPILLDKDTRVILDGHHRWWVARKLGFNTVPCLVFDYKNDQAISVCSRREDITIDKTSVLKMGLSDSVFPYKTTKHTYDFSLEAHDFVPQKLTFLRNTYENLN